MYAIGLMAMGFSPVVAENADEAFARACRICPDVIVTDVSLPASSRLTLVRRLRDDARTRTASIITIADATTVAQGDHDGGWDRSILKPCPPDVLGGQILALLASRGSASRNGSVQRPCASRPTS